MSSAGGNFLLLLWKNFVLQGRKKCVTVFEILVPVFFALLLLMIRALADSEYIANDSTWSRFYPKDVVLPSFKTELFFSPNTTLSRSLISTAMTDMNLTSNVTTFGFDTEGALLAQYNAEPGNVVWGAVVFDDALTGSTPPASLTFKLRVAYRTGQEDQDRWRTENTYPFFSTFGYRNNDSTGGEPFYYETGFLTLQYYINKAIIETHNNTAGIGSSVEVALKKMLYPPFNKDVLTTVLQTNLPLFLVLSFILNALQISKNIAYEKEKKLKEAMKMMGLSTFMYWFSWFIKCLLYLVVVLIIYTLVFSIKIGDKGRILNYADMSLFFVFLVLYILTIISFCFMISTFFSKANTAAFAAGILFFLSYFPYFFLADRYETMSQAEKLLACLLGNMGMAFGCNVIMIAEGTGDGVQWNNFHKPATVDDNLSLLDCMIMLLVDTVLYMLIAWYVDNINPGDAGVAQPPWFPFLPSYWCGSKVSDKDYENGDLAGTDPEYFERDPPGTSVGICIKHLKKKFSQKVAVRDTTLNMFEGQITALLGHNGAGKTTTISMLTGFLKPTSGTALINGYDIRTDIANVRKTLGLCPQHNILFDLLTVEEHLKFFAKLKGCPGKEVNNEVNKMIDILGLQQKRRALSSTLSGGQKRKLSVGIALIAGSKIVILDEPTSGMDPAARRQTWDILQKLREGRTIILTTHFMDEADILGDRIAIMADGVVKCCGTSMFLKKLYGAGYHMVCVKSKNCNVDKLTSVVQNTIPAAVVESEISAEISYLLPFEDSPKFEKLFTEIEVRMSELGITSFGTSATTMEEVFLKVGEGTADDDDDDDDNKDANNVGTSRTNFQNPNYGSHGTTGNFRKIAFDEKNGAALGPEVSTLSTKPKLPPISPESAKRNGGFEKGQVNNGYANSMDTVHVPLDTIDQGNYISYNEGVVKNVGFSYSLQQFYAMFVKKFIQARRNVAVAAAQLILPIVFTALALSIAETIPSVGDEPAYALDLSHFSDYTTAYSSGQTGNTSATTVSMANGYKDLFSSTIEVDRTVYAEMDNFFKAKADDIGISTFNRRYIVAGDYSETGSSNILSTAHFNGQPYHSPGISLQQTMSGLLKHFKDSTYSISLVNHPLPKKLSDNARRLFFSTNGTGFTIAISILFGMAFMSTSFIIFLIRERAAGAKHLQVVSGVGPFAFWFSTFLWDMLNYLIPVFVVMILFAAFQTEEYTSDNRLGIVFLIFLLYGWSVLPFVYLLHHLFMVPSTGMVTVSMINLLSGLVFLLATYTLSIPSLGTEEIGKALEWVFIVIFPNYDLGLALMDMYTNAGYKDTCDKPDIQIFCAALNIQKNTTYTNPCCGPDNCGDFGCFTYYDNMMDFNKPGIGRELLFMFLQGVVYFAIVLMAEFGVWRRCISAMSKSSPVAVGSMTNIRQTEDSDVAQESKRINDTAVNHLMQSDSMILKNMDKIYGSGFHAVKGISVGVPKNECFGLLGQNGAGKTSTFKMLTGAEPLTNGNAYLNGYSVKGDIKKVQQNLGYCPQFDALIDQMTGRETLYMYARLRGIEESQIKTVVNQLIDTMMLRKHVDKQTGFYSGGNKRKLSTAVALIGDPPFIFLDEPTTGMDPGARRQLWNVLSQVRASGRTLILTSHSMEECDALCTMIVIMVNGKFVCFGSPQHLKNKFGHGYTLFCRMGLNEAGYVSSSDELIAFVKSTFPNSEVFDDNQGYVHFQIPDENAKLAQIFGRMEEAKSRFNVEDYSVHQTTLEQIFLTFTQNQAIPKEGKKTGCFSRLCACL